MGFVGSRAGTKKSEIIRRLGPDFSGISAEELDADLDDLLDEENRGAVDPVLVGKDGRRFIRLKAPGGGIQKFYLEENGYRLEGQVQGDPNGGN